MPLGDHLAVKDVAFCGDRWYAAGGVLGPGDATRPAGWTSTDARSWTPVTFVPLPGSLYGPQNVIFSVGCTAGRVAMIGARSGGAHGVLRISTWRLRPDGAMAEVSAPFENYGGDTAVDVEHVVAGPAGFLISANRSSGAAILLSPDAGAFRLFEDTAGLASTPGHRTAARDAAPAADGRWMIVGGSAAHPAAWLTSDGSTFTPMKVPGEGELDRVIEAGSDLVAAGPRGNQLGVWRFHGTSWIQEGTFPGITIHGLAATANGLIAAADSGLWRSGDQKTWKHLSGPTGTIASDKDTVVVADGTRLWTTDSAI